ncbi:MAG: hypothetical protein PHX43_03870 [Alphaproteobacteria bacterium]|nr:hypothetical protein [Alphaproteobacteria bacterium]
MSDEFMLTTIDNPFDPFTQWDEWRRYDEDMGYFTCSYLARIAKTSDDLSEADYNEAVDDAIEEIVKLNINGMYRKTYRQSEDPTRGEA